MYGRPALPGDYQLLETPARLRPAPAVLINDLRGVAMERHSAFMTNAKAVYVVSCAAPDGRKLDVRFMDNGSIHIIADKGQLWAIVQHRTGLEGTRLQLVPSPETDGS